jgi:hypothetical protein
MYELETNNSFSSANYIPSGEVVLGQLSSEADVDYFKFTVSFPGIITVWVLPPSTLSYLSYNYNIYDPTGLLLGSGQSTSQWQGVEAAQGITTVAGDYYVLVNKNGKAAPSGIYTLNVSVPNETTAPSVSAFSPADGASSVAIDSNIVLTFNESVVKGTGSIQLRVGSATGTVFETFDAATSSRLTFSSSTLTIDPTNNLAGGTNYYVTLANGSVKDTAGNSYVGTTTYDLTTVQLIDYTSYIEAIYLAYYGRPADINGLVYWNTALNTVNGDLTSIINSFGTSGEATSLYSSSSNVAKINAIYMALFNRLADTEGLIYYVGLLTNGTKSQASIALDILNGATGNDLTLINKKLVISADFTTAMKHDATARIAYAGTTAATTARSMLSAVTASSDDSGVVNTTLNTIQTATTDEATVPEYKLVATSEQVNEGGVATFSLVTQNVLSGAVLEWKLTGVQAADIEGELSGSFTLDSTGKKNIYIKTVLDYLYESDETLTMTLEGQSASILIVGVSSGGGGGG